MAKWKIYNEDAVNWARNYQKAKFHALLTDAPYHLTTITKRFGKKDSAPAQYGTDGVFSRSSKGFMGQTWDGGELAFLPETWEAFGEVLYPGAFGMAFSASRNWHRMAVAIEDAGFILHPTIFLWAQGQGFPKATNISKQMDYHDGSQTWVGHRYGLQALKPAVEPIIVFQKPYEGRPLDNIVSTGAGALNIDGARIPLAGGDEYTINTFDDGAKPWGNGAGHKYTSRKVENLHRNPSHKQSWKQTSPDGSGSMDDAWKKGRWPANLILDEEGAKRMGDESRFFYNVATQLDESDPVYYCGKVSPKERNAGLTITLPENPFTAKDQRPTGDNKHPTLKPIDLCRYLATLLLPPADYAPRRIFIPFSGVASEMIGAGLAGWEHIVGVEFDKENGYVDIAEKRLQHWLKENK